VMVLELMGRDAGFITLHAGVAGGADVILIPEIPFEFESVCKTIQKRADRGRHFSIVAVSEGASPKGGQQVFSRGGDELVQARLGGIGATVAKFIEEACGMECRVMVLGHLQRGGSPTAFDRWLASRFGAAAFRLAEEGTHGQMVALVGGEVVSITLDEALAEPNRVDPNGDAVMTARNLGLSLGD